MSSNCASSISDTPRFCARRTLVPPGAYTRRYKGAGLGLPLAKGLAELHGASLDLKSAPSRGTSATVCFPRNRAKTTAGSGG